MKIKLNSHKIPEAVSLVSSIATLYSSLIGNVGTNKVLVEAKDGVVTCLFARQGVYVKTIISDAVIEEDGFFVAETKYLEKLRTADDISVFSTMEEADGEYALTYKNGRSTVRFIVSNNNEAFLKHTYDESVIPTDFVEIDAAVAKAIKNVSYRTNDGSVDKKLGLPICVTTKGDQIVVQTNDRYTAAAIYLPRQSNDTVTELVADSELLEAVCRFADADDKVQIAYNDSIVHAKCKKFDVITISSGKTVADADTYIAKFGKVVNRVVIDNENCNLSHEVDLITVVSNLGQSKPIIEVEIKENPNNPEEWFAFFRNSSNIGSASFRARVIEHTCAGKYRFNDNIVQMLSKIGDSNTVIEFYEKAVVFTNEDGTVKCIAPYV